MAAEMKPRDTQNTSGTPSSPYPTLAEFNWRRELLLISMAAMEVTWLSGWIKILIGVDQTASLTTIWLSTLAIYLLAMITARSLIQRPTPRIDWIIGGLILISTLIFLNLNLYPTVSLFNPRWFSLLVGNVTSGFQTWPREITTLFVGFFLWFRGLRLPQRRHSRIRASWGQVKIGLFMITALAVAAMEYPLNPGGIIATFFATSLLTLALTRIEETSRAQVGSASPFGRQWLTTLVAALFVVGVLGLIVANILSVDAIRTLLRPAALAIEAVLSAIAILAGLVAQYVLFPIVAAIFNRLFPEGLSMEFLEQFQQPEAGEAPQFEQGGLLPSPEVLNALRVFGLTVLTLIVLWLVIRSFRRWRRARETAGGVHDTATPTGSLAGDVLDYLRDQWARLRETDLRRLLGMRGTSSIRAIYANLLTLMAAADRPRRTGQTPYEFEPTAEELMPAHESDISHITEAYVRARYGEQDVDDDELETLRAGWQRIRVAGEQAVRQKEGAGTSEES